MRATVALLGRPLPWWGRAMIGVGSVAILMALGGALTRAWPKELGLIAAASIVTVVFGVLALSWPRAPISRRDGVALSLTPERVTLGRESFERSELTRALLMTTDAGAVVQLHRRGRTTLPIEIAFDSHAEAETFVRELGLAAEQKVAQFVALSPLAARRGYRAVFLGGLFFAHAAGLGAAIALSSYVPVALAMVAILATAITSAPSRLEIGVDGLSWRWLGRTRFVPWSRIRAARRVDLPGARSIDALEIEVDGEQVLRFAMARDAVGTDTPERVLSRIAQARRAGGERSNEHRSTILDAHEGSDAAAQLERVKRTASASDEYRTSPLAAGQAEAVLEDPKANPASRVLAAVAVIAQSPGEGRARVRITADATADRDLRAALEAVATEDEALLAERFSALHRRPRAV